MADTAEISRRLGVEPVAAASGATQWWCHDLTEAQADAAGELGLRTARRLHQMRVPLPLAVKEGSLRTRPFRVGEDDDAWLDVNNRAFSWHPDQGGWNPDDLRRSMAEPWFEPAGFLLAHLDGRLAGFCWTKFHANHDPTLGEIYVIGVDPDFQGRGLGRSLTVAGLAWQWQTHRPPLGMLYVEADNTAAVALYESLGFVVHHDDVAFELDESGGSNDGS